MCHRGLPRALTVFPAFVDIEKAKRIVHTWKHRQCKLAASVIAGFQRMINI